MARVSTRLQRFARCRDGETGSGSRRARLPLRHLLQRHAVSEDGACRRAAARAARLRRGVPPGADVLRADAHELGLRAGGGGAGAQVRARVRRRRSSRVPVGVVHGDAPPAGGRSGPRAERVPGGRAGRGGRRRALPAPRHVPSHLPLAARAGGGGPSAPAAPGREGDRARRAGAGSRMLRLWWDVRGEERRGLVGDAGRQGARSARHRSRDRVRRRQLVPDAHRRRAVAAADRREDAAPRRGACVVSFPKAASVTLRDSQLRRNLTRGTTTIRAKRDAVVSELSDWAALRSAGRAIKDQTLASLDDHLVALESAVVSAGGVVHWAGDGNEGCSIVAAIARAHGVDEVVKVKSIATDEIGLNEALASAGVRAVETDLAELIIQLGDDSQSHILVPAIHKNRAEIRELFARELGLPDLSDEPGALTE